MWQSFFFVFFFSFAPYLLAQTKRQTGNRDRQRLWHPTNKGRRLEPDQQQLGPCAAAISLSWHSTSRSFPMRWPTSRPAIQTPQHNNTITTTTTENTKNLRFLCVTDGHICSPKHFFRDHISTDKNESYVGNGNRLMARRQLEEEACKSDMLQIADDPERVQPRLQACLLVRRGNKQGRRWDLNCCECGVKHGVNNHKAGTESSTESTWEFFFAVMINIFSAVPT